MKLFNTSFDFDFFGRKAKERLEKQLHEQSLAINELQEQLSRERTEKEFEVHDVVKKPFRNLLYSNGIITVIFENGNVLSNTKPAEIVEQLNKCVTEDEVIKLLATELPKPLIPYVVPTAKPEVVVEDEKVIEKFVEYDVEVLELLGPDFKCEDSKFYYKDISLAINSIILNSLIETKKAGNEEGFIAVVNFFLDMALNPNEESRNDLLKVLKKFDVNITKNGSFFGYRRILKVDEDVDDDYVMAVSNEFQRIKRNKKGPGNFNLWEVSQEDGGINYESKWDGKEPVAEHKKNLGNLAELYKNLPEDESNNYTDKRTETYQIKIGATYKIREGEADVKRKKGSCGNALHVSLGKKYYDYSEYGDTDVTVIIKPRHVFRVDTGCIGKLGVSQMFIASKMVDGDEISEELLDMDDIYSSETTQELEEMLRTNSLDGLKVVPEENPVVNLRDVEIIKTALQNRITTF